MAKTSKKLLARGKRKARFRAKVYGTGASPRLCVYRSAKYTYAQLISDETGEVLLGLSSKDIDAPAASSTEGENTGARVNAARALGQKIAEVAKEKKISKVIFDRNGYLYHGRVAAVAEGAREGGLEF